MIIGTTCKYSTMLPTHSGDATQEPAALEADPALFSGALPGSDGVVGVVGGVSYNIGDSKGVGLGAEVNI